MRAREALTTSIEETDSDKDGFAERTKVTFTRAEKKVAVFLERRDHKTHTVIAASFVLCADGKFGYTETRVSSGASNSVFTRTFRGSSNIDVYIADNDTTYHVLNEKSALAYAFRWKEGERVEEVNEEYYEEIKDFGPLLKSFVDGEE